MACAWLIAALGERPALPRGLRGQVGHTAWRQVAELAEKGLASPLTTSAGRLFDAVAALCGIRAEVSYEGQAAVELEAAADPAERGAYPLPLAGEAPTGEPLILDARPTIRAVVRDVERGIPVPIISARFHNALAVATVIACRTAAERARVSTVVLSGGVFQNGTLLARTRALLEADGLRVLVPELLPPNDGGISYGQLAVASARLMAEDASDVRA
jgi:hydrogenase maturation protein HypF